MRESSEAKADAATWRRKAEEEQQLVGQANSILQQRNAEVSVGGRRLTCACVTSCLLSLCNQCASGRMQMEHDPASACVPPVQTL